MILINKCDDEIQFTNVDFSIEDGGIVCEVRWLSTDPLLTGYGARKKFHYPVSIAEIVSEHLGSELLTNKSWTIYR